jgi:sugar-specific transcriptional regulator TrmB
LERRNTERVDVFRQQIMEKLFRNLGLEKKEMETFLHLLELGPQPVSVVAKQAGIPRTSMYEMLSRLKKSHLVEEFERKGMKYVRCIPVKSIGDVLRNREKQIQQTLTLLEDNMEQLEALESSGSITPKVRFFEGKEEVMRMYALIVREPKFCAFVNLESVKECMPEYHDLIPEMLRDAGGTARELAVDSPEARSYKKKYHSKKHRIGLLPKDLQFTSDVIICEDHLYMTAYGREMMSARQLFEKLWSMYGE